jgi:hypothetical protein
VAQEHKLERRSRLLADAIKARTTTLAQSITPRGGRPPFTDSLNRTQAMEWWSKHRYDPYGETLVKRMQPTDVMQLDNALGAYMAEKQRMGPNG